MANSYFNDSFYPPRKTNSLDGRSAVDRLKLSLQKPLPINGPNQPSVVVTPKQTSAIAPDNSNQDDSQEYDQDSHDEINSIIDAPLKSAVSMRLKNLLATYPNPDQYKPSKKRRVLSAIAGGAVGATQGAEAGAKLSTEMVDNPYKKALQSWESQYKPAEQEYNMGLAAQKAGFSNLSDYASYYRAKQEYDPKRQGQIAGAKATGELPAKLTLQTTADTNALNRDRFKEGEETKRSTSRINAENSRSTQDNQTRVNMQNVHDTWMSNENALDRKSREMMNRLDREARRDIASATIKNTRVPVNDQVRARFEAEHQVLNENALQPGDNPIRADELKAISVVIKDKDGNVIGRSLKPRAEVDPLFQKNWDIIKQRVDAQRDKLLKGSFSPVNRDDGNIDSEWEDTTPEDRQ